MEHSTSTVPQGRAPMSPIRKRYWIDLVIRCIIFLFCVLLWLRHPSSFDILYGMRFFSHFSVLHLLWLVWVLDMLCQLIPAKRQIALGSQKLFQQRFRPIREKINHQALRDYIVSTTKSAYKVMVLWVAFGAVQGLLYHLGILNRSMMFLLSAAFYVCDLICVLIWCPFRLMMKNCCCTTCRIFNWDHLMMFTPLFFVPSFYSWSLCFLSVVVFCMWELSVLLHPERFWEQSNEALKCSNCTDKLCTQYCQKLRK